MSVLEMKEIFEKEEHTVEDIENLLHYVRLEFKKKSGLFQSNILWVRLK